MISILHIAMTISLSAEQVKKLKVYFRCISIDYKCWQEIASYFNLNFKEHHTDSSAALMWHDYIQYSVFIKKGILIIFFSDKVCNHEKFVVS